MNIQINTNSQRYLYQQLNIKFNYFFFFTFYILIHVLNATAAIHAAGTICVYIQQNQLVNCFIYSFLKLQNRLMF